MKKMICFFISLCLMVSISIPTFAKEDSNKLKKAEIQNQLKSLEEKYGIEFVDLDSENNQCETEEFESIEDFEEFLKSFIKSLKNEKEKFKGSESVINQLNVNNNMFSILSTQQGSHTFSWWAPFSAFGFTGLLCWRNIAFEYEYDFVNNHPQFTSVSNVSSYMTGVTWIYWNQTRKSISYSSQNYTKDTVSIEVSGYYLLGISVKGFEVGVKMNDTWPEKSLTLISN